jgi:hypothetical protein
MSTRRGERPPSLVETFLVSMAVIVLEITGAFRGRA